MIGVAGPGSCGTARSCARPGQRRVQSGRKDEVFSQPLLRVRRRLCDAVGGTQWKGGILPSLPKDLGQAV